MQWVFSMRNINDTRIYAHLVYDWDKDLYNAYWDKELPIGAPAIMQIFCKRGKYEMDDKFCRLFIRDRVIPANRQNIGQILREIGVKYYHECFIMQHCPMSVMDDAYIELEKVIE